MKYCIDCKKKISFYAKRCRKCNFIYQQGENNPNWRNGLPKCVDCKKQLSTYGKIHIRCRSCAQIERFKDPRNHPMHLKQHSTTTKRKMSLTREGTGIPYEINDYPERFFKIRKIILQRDNYICQKCNKKGTTVHHIDYNKENCKKRNLITTCRDCNVMVNSNRDYWYAYFRYIMENR
jgi:hypothetical protein